MLQEAFASINYSQYRMSMAEDPTAYSFPESKMAGHLTAAFIKEIFSVDENGTLIFKFRPFYQALIPPQTHLRSITESDETLYEVLVSKQHFYLYLTSSLSEPFVFGNTPDGKAYPIFLAGNDSSAALYRPMQYHLALDCSSSMIWKNNSYEDEDPSIFAEALGATGNVVTKISQSTADGDSLTLHLIQSPGTDLISRKYTIHDEEQRQSFLTFLGEQKAEFSTNLYGVMVNIISKIEEDDKRIPSTDHTVIIITDGADQNETEEATRLWELIQQKCNEFKRSSFPPKFYILTIDRNVKDKRLIDILKISAGASEIEVNDPAQFEQRFERLQLTRTDAASQTFTSRRATSRVC